MRGLFAVFHREARLRFTNATWIFWDLMLPVLYLLLFGLGLQRTFAGGVAMAGQASVPYLPFFLGGVLAMACFTIATNTSYGFYVDRDNGLLYEFLTYPLSRAVFLLGRILFNCALALLQALATLALARWVLGIEISTSRLPLLLPAVALSTAGWFFLFATVAFRIRRADVYGTVINVLYFVLLLVSSLFYPLEPMPGWFRALARLSPMTWNTDTLRYLSIGAGRPSTVLAEFAAFLVFTGLAFLAAVWSMRKLE